MTENLPGNQYDKKANTDDIVIKKERGRKRKKERNERNERKREDRKQAKEGRKRNEKERMDEGKNERC